MRSTRPKPLHLLCGQAMVLYVLDSLGDLDLDRAVVVVGHGAERVTKKLSESAADLPARVRRAARAAGHRRRRGRRPHRLPRRRPLDDDDGGDVLVLPGDTPLLRAEHRRRPSSTATAPAAPPAPSSPPWLDDPTGYGRVVRGTDDRVVRIVEQRDATPEELEITESTRRSTASAARCSRPALRRVTPDNAQGEYYLTDVVAGARRGRPPRRRRACATTRSRPPGINDRPPAGGRRGRAAPPHQRRAGCGAGVTMVDPAHHLRRRHGAPRRRRHPLPRRRAPGRDGRGRGRRDRARHPPRRLRRRRPRRRSRPPSAATPRSATTPSSGPFAALGPGAVDRLRARAPAPTTLRPDGRAARRVA